MKLIDSVESSSLVAHVDNLCVRTMPIAMRIQCSLTLLIETGVKHKAVIEFGRSNKPIRFRCKRLRKFYTVSACHLL